MSVVISLEAVGPCRKQLTVEVPLPAVEAETQRVIQEFSRKVKLPGFRRGKVPPDLIRRRFQKEIHQEVVDRLVPRYLRQAQAEAHLDPLLPPLLEEVELEPGAPLTFVATVETRPEIELRNIRDFHLPTMDVEPTEEEISRALEDLRHQAADWKPVERPAARGDRVKARMVETLAEGREGRSQVVEVEVGAPGIGEELSLALTGLAPGQETEFVPPPEEEEEPRERRVRIEVLEIQEKDLPPLDDAFAQRVGRFQDLQALRQEVARSLRRSKVEEWRRRREEAVMEQLRERHPIQLPQGVVDEEVDRLVRDYAESLARQGVDLERSQIDWERVAGEMRPYAERRVHARLLLDAIAEMEAVDVSEDQFERTLASLARAQGRSTAALRKDLDEAGKLQALRAQLRRQEVLSRLIGETPPAAPAPETGISATT